MRSIISNKAEKSKKMHPQLLFIIDLRYQSATLKVSKPPFINSSWVM